MFFRWINQDVSESPRICWEVEVLVYGFMVDECYSSERKTFESFVEEAMCFADELSAENRETADILRKNVDWLDVFNSYAGFMEGGNNLSPEQYFQMDRDQVIKWMRKNGRQGIKEP